jgi:thiol:disulfide interchange protein/DsbC/DsbD-like thiol-disulfide interchange protein
MTAIFRIFLTVVAAFLLFAPSVHAQAVDKDNGNRVTVRLLAEKTTLMPGDEIWIGVEQNIAQGWHTYWVNPGDSGAQARFEWSAPDGFEFGDIQWPVPKKLPYGDLMNYGYETSAVFLQKLTVPENIPEGPIALSLDYDTLVCKEECIPESGTYEITFNAGEPDEDNTALYIMSAFAKIPTPHDGFAMYDVQADDDGENESILLSIAVDPAMLANISSNAPVEFYPLDWGIVENTAPQSVSYVDGQFVIKQLRGGRGLSDIADAGLNGVLKYTDARGRDRGIEFTATQRVSVQDAVADETPEQAEEQPEDIAAPEKAETPPLSFAKLAQILSFALLGGLILNLMPCVFPVLSMKALSLVKSVDKDTSHVRLSGVAYTLGVVLSFLAVAGLLIALQSAGAKIGWGFHLQNPLIVGGLVYVLLAVGLNLSGVFEISNRFGNIGSKLTQGQGMSASFFTGVLATVVATPCTAPFMAGAVGFALTQSAGIALLVFGVLGLGLALPYLLLCYVPVLQHIMPKPGAWMDSFKSFLAFPVYASAAWLVWVFAKQSDDFALLILALGFVGLIFVAWLLKRKPQSIVSHIFKYGALILVLLSFVIGVQSLNSEPSQNQNAVVTETESKTIETTKKSKDTENENFYSEFSTQALEAALSSKDPVFVEMTAAWCITCKVNHKTSLNIEKTRRIIDERNVQYLVGDWTNQDSVITEYLEQFDRSGVPIYVYYPAPDENGVRSEPELLPQILTPGIVAKYLDRD